MVQRIVSFLPSATELLFELGAGDLVFGVTHECLYPNEAKTKPRVINSVFDPEKMSSKEIDQTTCTLLSQGKEIFTLNEENLIKANPDLIISQNTCEVCAAHTNQVNQALEILKTKPIIHSLDPHNLEEILETVLEISNIIGREQEGKILCESLKNRIESIKKREVLERPRVLVLEWVDPLFTSGHWVPEMVTLAGGINLVSKVGEHSRKMNLQEAKESDPEIIILMPCGFNTDRAIHEYNSSLKTNDSWKDFIKGKKVYAVDANSYFSKPSIRTVTGIEILSKILHPREFEDILVPENSFQIIG